MFLFSYKPFESIYNAASACLNKSPGIMATMTQRNQLRRDGPVSTNDRSVATQRLNPLRARMRDAEVATRLSADLHGQLLPDVELTTCDGVCVPLRAHVSGLLVTYLVPGGQDGASWIDGVPTRDAAQHRGYVKRRAVFEQLDARAYCVSSQPQDELRRIAHFIEAQHLMFSDPELAFATALGLPTVRDSGVTRHRRVTLVSIDGRIERAFGPLSDSDAAGSAQQVLTWLQATR